MTAAILVIARLSHGSPEMSLDPSTVSVTAINALVAASTSPLCNLSPMALSSRVSVASGVRSAASGGLEVILSVAMANESNLSMTRTHSCRMLFGPDPAIAICCVSGSGDGARYVSQTCFSMSSPKAYRRGPASESVIHCFAASYNVDNSSKDTQKNGDFDEFVTKMVLKI